MTRCACGCGKLLWLTPKGRVYRSLGVAHPSNTDYNPGHSPAPPGYCQRCRLRIHDGECLCRDGGAA